MIDIEKSIRRERLVFRTDLKSVTSHLFNSLIGFICIGLAFILPAIDLWNAIKSDRVSVLHIIFILIMWTMGSWIIYGLLRINKLKRIRGLDINRNKKIINGLLEEYYTDLKFYFDKDSIVGHRSGTLKQNAKKILVLFNETDVYINIKTFLRLGIVESQFHVIGNESDIKELEKRFRAVIKNAPQQRQ